MADFFFTSLSMDHLKMLHKWAQEPHVCLWWGDGRSWSFNDIKEKYSSYTFGYKIQQGLKKPIYPFVIEFQKRPIGFIQFYDALDFPREGFNTKDLCYDQSQSLAAIDFYIGEPDYIGQGLGAKVLKAFLSNHVFHYYDACLADPDKNNIAAIKAYVRAGFSIFRNMDSCIIMIAQKD